MPKPAAGIPITTSFNHGTMEINSGVSVTQNGQFSSMIENGWYNGSQNTGGKNSVLTINGGTFSGGLNTIKNDDYGELVINDGTFTSMSQAAFLNWNVATVNGGTFDAAGASNGVILNAISTAPWIRQADHQRRYLQRRGKDGNHHNGRWNPQRRY